MKYVKIILISFMALLACSSPRNYTSKIKQHATKIDSCEFPLLEHILHRAVLVEGLPDAFDGLLLKYDSVDTLVKKRIWLDSIKVNVSGGRVALNFSKHTVWNFSTIYDSTSIDCDNHLLAFDLWEIDEDSRHSALEYLLKSKISYLEDVLEWPIHSNFIKKGHFYAFTNQIGEKMCIITSLGIYILDITYSNFSGAINSSFFWYSKPDNGLSLLIGIETPTYLGMRNNSGVAFEYKGKKIPFLTTKMLSKAKAIKELKKLQQ